MKKNEKWKICENITAKDYNLRKTPGSGNLFHSKGDCSNHELMIEVKSTEKDSFSINKNSYREWLRNAAREGKQFFLEIHFLNENGSSERYVVAPQKWFKAIYDRNLTID